MCAENDWHECWMSAWEEMAVRLSQISQRYLIQIRFHYFCHCDSEVCGLFWFLLTPLPLKHNITHTISDPNRNLCSTLLLPSPLKALNCSRTLTTCQNLSTPTSCLPTISSTNFQNALCGLWHALQSVHTRTSTALNKTCIYTVLSVLLALLFKTRCSCVCSLIIHVKLA